MKAKAIRITGIVQGVGFRPMVWNIAHQLKLQGKVWNDNNGVMIHVWGSDKSISNFIKKIQTDLPPLAQIDQIFFSELNHNFDKPDNFSIVSSQQGDMNTCVVADAATCRKCIEDIEDPSNRRYRYPFTNCTHCGPRMSIIRAMPYDRINTSMAAFTMCSECQEEYDNPANRRFHAQPNACPQCGPQLWLEPSAPDKGEYHASGEGVVSNNDPITTAVQLIKQGYIIAIKGIGGFHLACDASNDDSVNRLRQRKHRYKKPFALMAKDIAIIKNYSYVSNTEASLLKSTAAPIVILEKKLGTEGVKQLSDDIAKGQNNLGFMLPYTPLHHLLMQDMTQPLVFTSANISEEPQLIDNDIARQRLSQIADYFLFNNRDIINRLDDSVVCIMDNKPRFLRRARGYTPLTLALPDDFPKDNNILAMGGELKNTFCILKNETLVVSQYIGDLENTLTLKDYQYNLKLYSQLYDFKPEQIVVDRHPDYLSTQEGQKIAASEGLVLTEVQHHHAHLASCMLEHGLGMNNSGNILGIALDGLGLGLDNTIWGGEFFLVNYKHCERLASFQPVSMPGGTRAIKEPWRNTLAHLLENSDWENVSEHYAQLDIIRFLKQQPVNNLKIIINKDINSPRASSAGRLFDAVAAALGVCTESVSFEGQAAIELEALAGNCMDNKACYAYPFKYQHKQIIWQPMWCSLFEDLANKVLPQIISAKFHQCVIQAVAQVALQLSHEHHIKTIALSGGVFQNKLLLEGVSEKLRTQNLNVISPQQLPMNDAGISAGQIAIALCRQ